MKSADPYRNPISLTSQFYFCGLPLRLDTYANCQFACHYCFAATRGGSRSSRGIRPADGHVVVRRLQRLRHSGGTLLGEMVGARQAIHFGGMSDPLPPAERKFGVTLEVLRDLAIDDYPVVLSTKSSLAADDAYLSVLARPNALVQMSFSVADDNMSVAIDKGAPSTSQRLATLARLADAGAKTSARLQPVLPGQERETLQLLQRLAQVGVTHVGVEYLKVPLERWKGEAAVSAITGLQITDHYRSVGSIRIGREWVLPVDRRLGFTLEARRLAHHLGMTFGAADTDLLPLGDGAACCSGADLLLPHASTFEYNYLGAVARADAQGRITLSSLSDVWRPTSSASSMINSRSRIPAEAGKGQPVEAYIRRNWNGRQNGCAPDMFYGIHATTARETDGSVVYQISDELRSLMVG